MKATYTASDGAKVTTYKVGHIAICEVEESIESLHSIELLMDMKELDIIAKKNSSPRGDRAQRMKELISVGTDKKTVRYMMERDGYVFNPPSVFHSEFSRLSKK